MKSYCFACVTVLLSCLVGCAGGQQRPAVANPTAFPTWTSLSTVAVIAEASIDLDGVAAVARPDVAAFRAPLFALAGEMLSTRTVEQFVPAEDGSDRGIFVQVHVLRYSYRAGRTGLVNLTLGVEVRAYDLRDVERTSRFDATRQATVPVLHTGEAAPIGFATFDLDLEVYQRGRDRVRIWHEEIAPEVARQVWVNAADALREAADASERPREAAAAADQSTAE